jgi:hypothetical protein
VALLLGGPPVIWTTAFVVTACIDRLGRLLGRWGAAPFFLQMVGGLVATVSTVGLFAVGALPPATEPSLVIAASITVLLSGLSVMSAVQDAISGHPGTAAGRAAEIASLSAGLLTGVVLGLKMGIEFRLILDPARTGGRRPHPVRDLDVRGGRDVRAGLLRAAALADRGRAGGWDRLGSQPPQQR